MSIVSIPGYSLFRRDRPTGHGGVCTYVSEELSASDVTNIHLSSNSCEQIWCELNIGPEKILVGNIYRPPKNDLSANTTINKSITEARNLLNKKLYSGLLITGDFNFPDIAWDTEHHVISNHPVNSPEHEFIETLNETFLVQHVNIPTFQDVNLALGNTLDLIITESDNRILNLISNPPLAKIKKGHLILEFSYVVCGHTKIEQNYNSNKLNYNKADFKEINNRMSDIKWPDGACNIDQIYSCFTEKYDTSCQANIPKSNSSKRKATNPWVTRDLIDLIKLKKKLWHKTLASGGTNNLIIPEYKRVSKLVKNNTKIAVMVYEKELVEMSKLNPKLIYSYIKRKQNVKDHIRMLIKDGGDTTTDKQEIVNTLNRQFKSVFVDEHLSDIPVYPDRTAKTINENNVTPFLTAHNIKKHLNNINSDKSMGCDKIHPHVLKECSESSSIALEKIFVKSIIDGAVPSAWKEANITPIYKKGSKVDPANYRPISLTSVPCKVIEKIIRD